MRASAFNAQIFLEFLCYSIFGGLLWYLVSSEKYLTYVTPRMKPYLYFTVVIMGLWALAGLFRVRQPQHRIRAAHCFVIVVPLLLLIFPHSPLSTSDFSGGYISGNTLLGQAGQYRTPKQTAPNGTGPAGDAAVKEPAQSSTQPAADISDMVSRDPTQGALDAPQDTEAVASNPQNDVPDASQAAALPGLDTANKKIIVSNDNFGMWLSEIYINMEKYEGYTIVMTGFVFKDPEMLKEDEFVPARLMMSCCVADLAPVGLLCKYAQASGLQQDSWVTVEGTLFVGEVEYFGETYNDPQIRVTGMTPAEAVEGYVYPY